jgi:hypothetical protein
LSFTPLDPLSEVLDCKLLPDFGVGVDVDLECVIVDDDPNPIKV